jgi:UDPglucose--hexose-1-phosphate uridylyltransferase
VIALPLLPPKVEAEAVAYDKYIIENSSCPFCDIISKESNGPRVIWEDENLFVLAPYASESPYGAWFLPKRHLRTIVDLSHAEKKSIAMAMKVVLGKLDELGISYNYFVENAVCGADYHMHIKLAPRPNVWAGLELGTGVIVNFMPPEKAAEIYRS